MAFSPSLVSAYGESSPSRSILASIGSFFKGLVFSSDNQSDNQNENDSNVIAYDRAEFEKQLQQQKQDIEEALTAAKRAETKYNFLKSELDNIKASGLKIEGRTTENKTIEKTVEKIVSGLSQNDLDSGIASVRAELNNLNTNLTNQLNTLSASSNRQTSAVYQAVSLTNKIDSLSGTRLSNITVSGVSGLTDSDIPDTITASNYLPLAGGTLTGNLLMPASAYLNFGTDSGSSGYGVRDNGGTIQVKNSAGSWSNIPTSGITQWTTTGDNIYYTSGNIGIGTTSPNWKLSVAGIGSFDNYVRASYFTATSTTASTFPYASTTAITATTASTTNLIVSNNSTLGTVVGGAWQGTAIGDGYLTKSGDWTGTLDGQEGSYYSNANNLTNFGSPFYTFFNGTTTDALAQGSTNKYWSNTLFDNRLSATTTLPNLTTLLGLTNATTSGLTVTGNAYFAGSGIWNSSGNVGIGTIAPQGRLSLGGTTDGSGSVAYGITFHGDGSPHTHAGIWSQGSAGWNGSLIFATDGDGVNNNNPTEKMRIQSNGNVGIGTTTPAYKLEVNEGNFAVTRSSGNLQNRFKGATGGINEIIFGDQAVANLAAFTYDGSIPRFSLRTLGATRLALGAADAEDLTISTSHNVGIGTTTPSAKLHVQMSSEDWNNGIKLSDVDGDRWEWIISGNDLTLGYNGATRIFHESGGGLGIGTGVIASMLDVEGGAAIGASYSGSTAAPANGLIVEGNVGIGTTGPERQFQVANTAANAQMSLKSHANGTAEVLLGDTNSILQGAFSWYGGTQGAYLNLFSPTGKNLILQKDGGNVGIGTTTPAAKLHSLSTTEQLRLGYDSAQYAQFTIDTNGNLKIDPTGSTITVPDQNLKICANNACQTTALNSGNGNLTVENNIEIGGNYNRTCPTNATDPSKGDYIWVPGSAKFGTLPGFCVMKYEAKNDGSNNAVSTATGGPYVSIDQPTSRTKCEAIGLGYHLISEPEWMTIAENIAQTPINDLESTAGLQLATGHSDNIPASALAATSASDPVVSGCVLTSPLSSNTYSAGVCELRGDGSYGGDDNDKGYYGTGQAYAGSYTSGGSNDSQLRTHILSNGNVIWDIAGNIWEWTDAYVNGTAEKPAPTADVWAEYTAITDYTALNYSRPQNPAWTSANGIGQYYAGASVGQRGFIRGGRWSLGAADGVFALGLDAAPSSTLTLLGFRCSR